MEQTINTSLPGPQADGSVAEPAVLARRYQRDENLVTRQVAGETLLVPIRGQVGDLESIFTLNELATFIWARLDGRTTVGQIVQELCAEYDVDETEARRDALEFLQTLEADGLIRQNGE